MIGKVFILVHGIKNMALDELKLLIDRLRRLIESDDPDEDKIDMLRDKIEDLISISNAKVTVTCTAKKDVMISDLDYCSVIDDLVDDPTMSLEEIISNYVCSDVSYYIPMDEINVTIYDGNGEELDSCSYS